MTIVPPGQWEFFVGAERFSQLNGETRFQRMLTLGRIVNSIRFVQGALHVAAERTTPAGARQRAAGYLYLAALIQEALRFAERLRKDFRESPAFVVGLDALLRDPQVAAMRAGVLGRLRDQAIYHHDDVVTTDALPLMQAEAYVLASGEGRQRGDVYYELADIVVLQHALQSAGNPIAFGDAVAEFTTALARLATQFARNADELIAEVLQDYGVPHRAGA